MSGIHRCHRRPMDRLRPKSAPSCASWDIDRSERPLRTLTLAAARLFDLSLERTPDSTWLRFERSVLAHDWKSGPRATGGTGRCALGTGQLQQGGDLPEAAPRTTRNKLFGDLSHPTGDLLAKSRLSREPTILRAIFQQGWGPTRDEAR